MKPSLRISLLVLLLLAITFVGLIVFYLARNTSFLTRSIDQQTLTLNNKNSEEFDRYANLISQELIVSEDQKVGIFTEPKLLNLPEKFKITLWASGLNKPRHMDWDSQGNLILADMGSSTIKMFKENSETGLGELVKVIDSNLDVPNSVQIYNGDLYVGTQGQVLLYKNLDSSGEYESKSVVIDNMPTGTQIGNHRTRTVRIGPDNKLYVSIGSSCNVCIEADQRRASIIRSDLDGSNQEVFATGLRNTVDFIFKKAGTDFQIWGVDNGRDLIGDDLPPEEVNVIIKDKDYGWPFCYGNGINNPEYPERSGFCLTETQRPIYNLQAHSAPLGLTFLVNDNLEQRTTFPLEIFNDDLFVAYHGSWNRSIPTGYKIVRVDTSITQSTEINFITGWLTKSAQAWGRPVDVKFDPLGNMFITDDLANAIYKVEYLEDL